jgi:hypothetical protein
MFGLYSNARFERRQFAHASSLVGLIRRRQEFKGQTGSRGSIAYRLPLQFSCLVLFISNSLSLSFSLSLSLSLSISLFLSLSLSLSLSLFLSARKADLKKGFQHLVLVLVVLVVVVLVLKWLNRVM